MVSSGKLTVINSVDGWNSIVGWLLFTAPVTSLLTHDELMVDSWRIWFLYDNQLMLHILLS